MKQLLRCVAFSAAFVLLTSACDVETPELQEDGSLQSAWFHYRVTDVTTAPDDLLPDSTIIYVHGEVTNRTSETHTADLDFFLLGDETQNTPLAQPLYVSESFRVDRDIPAGESRGGYVSFTVNDSHAEPGRRMILGVDLGWTVQSGLVPFYLPSG